MKIWGILTALILISLISFIDNAEAGVLELSTSRIDFGNVKEGLPIIKTVFLKNSGKQTLNISNVKAS